MTNDLQISHIRRFDPREAWSSEPQDFTPWLAQEDNFKALADALHLFEAETDAVEFRIGDFSADIVGKDRDGLLLIENQLEQSDHTHLGQILTYLAGLNGPAKIVWICTRVREEHRAAIDWLNEQTSDEFSFFAVELELIKIGDSDFAPLFHVTAKPNFWSRHATARTKAATSSVNSERQRKYETFWKGLAIVMDDRDSGFRGSNPPKDHWWQFPTGKAGISTTLTAGGRDHYAGVELYIHNDEDKQIFELFHQERAKIERELGEDLIWERLEERKGSRIVKRRTRIDPFDDDIQIELYEWYWNELQKFRAVFLPMIRDLL